MTRTPLSLTPLDDRLTPAIAATYAGLLDISGTAAPPWPDYRGGLEVVQVGDVTGDGVEDVAIGAGAGGGPRISLIDGATREQLDNRYAYEDTFLGGVNIGYENGTLYVGPGEGGGPVGVRLAVAGGRFAELDRRYYGDPDSRSGLRFAGSDARPLGYTVGAGRLTIYLELDHLRPFEAAAVVDTFYGVFGGIADLLTVTTTKPALDADTYVTVYTRADLSHLPGSPAGVTYGDLGFQHLFSNYRNPIGVHLSRNLSLAALPYAAAHEVGHLLGLSHLDDPANVMDPLSRVGGAFTLPVQVAVMRGTILRNPVGNN